MVSCSTLLETFEASVPTLVMKNPLGLFACIDGKACPGPQPPKRSGAAELTVTFGNDHDVIDVQSTMM